MEQLVEISNSHDDSQFNMQTYFPRPGETGYRERYNRRGGRGGAPRSTNERSRQDEYVVREGRKGQMRW